MTTTGTPNQQSGAGRPATGQGLSGELHFVSSGLLSGEYRRRIPASHFISTERDLMTSPQTTPVPGEALKAEKMPGHWLLARLGKRVLRPGGRQLTNRMIEALNICPSDAVIEFAPGLGATARLTLKRKPTSYTAVERDKDAAALVQKFLQGPEQRCVVGLAEHTGLPGVSATVVYGEAMLSMQTPEQKSRIVQEAHKLL